VDSGSLRSSQDDEATSQRRKAPDRPTASSPAAEADGVQVGDVVLTINDQPTSKLDYNRWQALLQEEQALTLELKRAKVAVIERRGTSGDLSGSRERELDNRSP
jgi:C-terminal processing protease CtpA/Prc